MGVQAINSYEEFKSIIDRDRSAIIDFWAPWCGPCKAISPVLDKLSEDYDSADFYKINIDDLPNVAEEVQIRVIPTFMVFQHGEKVNEMSGANPNALKDLVEAVV